ncbi:hypothetical protein [Pseudonocardia sp. GCM10023141]|uniref:hypothetical protein n=1 Tax=Pseudonocardia sp. GCM10023141 TaxID=3252653 RepID=UPI003614CFE2
MTVIPQFRPGPGVGLDAIERVAPHAFDALTRSWAAVQQVVDPALLDAVAARMNALLGRAPGAAAATAGFEAELALVDQFVDYVPDIDDELLDPLRARYTKTGLRDLVDALYVIDQTTRLRIAHRALHLSSPEAAAQRAAGAPPDGRLPRPARSNMVWHDTILTTNPLGSFTRELVRLRCGSYHQCGICSSMRLVEDGARVVPPELEPVLADHATAAIPAAQKAALRYAEAHMTDPLAIDDALVAELARHFSSEQLVQLTLEVSSWNYQKVLVALGLDAPVVERSLVAMTIGDDGHCVSGSVLS